MSVTIVAYNVAKKDLLNGTIDLDSDTLKIGLLTSSYTPNIDTDKVWSDISANEISGTGYTAGGATLASASATEDDTGDRGLIDYADPSWTSASFTAHYAVIYDTTNTNSLVCYINFGADETVSSGTFTITLNASGLASIT